MVIPSEIPRFMCGSSSQAELIHRTREQMKEEIHAGDGCGGRAAAAGQPQGGGGRPDPRDSEGQCASGEVALEPFMGYFFLF